MQDRRRFMVVFASLFAAAPLVHLLGSGAITKSGKHYVVNGWILTDADLEALERHFSVR